MKWLLRFAAFCVGLGIALPAFAQTCLVPHLLQNGTIADATEVMDNFNTHTVCIQTLQAFFPGVGFTLPSTGMVSANAGSAIARAGDRLFVGKNANANDGNKPEVAKDWLETILPNTTSIATIVGLGQNAGIGLLGGVRTSDGSSGDYSSATMGLCINNTTSPSPTACTGGYFETEHVVGANGTNYSHGVEIDIDEFNSGTVSGTVYPVHYQPYTSPFPNGLSDALRLGSGGGRAGVQTATDAIAIINNGAAFQSGIVFQQNSIFGTGGLGGQGEAIAMATGHQINWYSSDGLINTTLVGSGLAGSAVLTMFVGGGSTTLVSSKAAGLALSSNNPTMILGAGSTPPADTAQIYFLDVAAAKYSLGIDGTGNNFVLVDDITLTDALSLVSGNLTVGETGATLGLMGAVKFTSAVSWSANGSVATTMTGIGPAGSHTTVQEWLTVVDSAGVVRYVPAY